jgi:NADH dehydrogenase [ubiquinone] 1 alpha subcomplex assembly factor 7
MAGAGLAPERLDRFMARANAVYYARRDPFADFTTAPEICQAFGEVLGAWAAVTWEQLGRPAPVLLAEAGPGRGTLMRDAVRAIAAVAPAFLDALTVHLIETSPRLRGQASVPGGVTWHTSAATLPEMPLILLGNEFLDALPIRQFVRRGAGWAERFVGPEGFVERPCAPPGREAADGEVVEICEPALELAEALGRRFAARPGAALFLDYGPTNSTPGDSLQAIRDRRPANPLADPGNADLTAHVDFAAIAGVAAEAGATAHGPLPQGVFLTRLGLPQRADRLARTLPPRQALALLQSARRLIEPDQMGRLFKALVLCSPGCPIPAGFEV